MMDKWAQDVGAELTSYCKLNDELYDNDEPVWVFTAQQLKDYTRAVDAEAVSRLLKVLEAQR